MDYPSLQEQLMDNINVCLLQVHFRQDSVVSLEYSKSGMSVVLSQSDAPVLLLPIRPCKQKCLRAWSSYIAVENHCFERLLCFWPSFLTIVQLLKNKPTECCFWRSWSLTLRVWVILSAILNIMRFVGLCNIVCSTRSGLNIWSTFFPLFYSVFCLPLFGLKPGMV